MVDGVQVNVCGLQKLEQQSVLTWQDPPSGRQPPLLQVIVLGLQKPEQHWFGWLQGTPLGTQALLHRPVLPSQKPLQH